MNIPNDSINLHGAPHTVCEMTRETFSTIPEKTEEEIYAQKPEESKPTVEEEPSVDEEGGEEEGQ